MRDVAVHGRYAFVAEADTGIRVVDIATPTQPKSVALFGVPKQVLGVAAANGQLLIAEAQSLKGGVRLCDVADSGALTEVGYWECDTDVWDIAVFGTRAFVSMASDGVHLLDLGNPRAPKDLGRLDLSNAVWGVAPVGDCLYAALGKDGLGVLKLRANASQSEPRL